MPAGCLHPSRTYFPGYRYPLCLGCYDEAYLAWFKRVTREVHAANFNPIPVGGLL